MSLKLKFSPRSLPPYHTAQNQPSQRTSTGHQHIFMSAAGCPDTQELLNAHVAKAPTCGYTGAG